MDDYVVLVNLKVLKFSSVVWFVFGFGSLLNFICSAKLQLLSNCNDQEVIKVIVWLSSRSYSQSVIRISLLLLFCEEL